jgi:D-proline reductase (dithiol) PrdB
MLRADEEMRTHFALIPVPDFPDPAFTIPPTLRDATIAIVTTAALHRPHDDPFSRGDTTFRTLDRSDRDLRLGHWSLNFDRSGFAEDVNVVYPIDRLEELAADGTIGAVSPRHLSFAGAQPDTLAEIRLDTGPAAARRLRDDGVDVVLLTPV